MNRHLVFALILTLGLLAACSDQNAFAPSASDPGRPAFKSRPGDGDTTVTIQKGPGGSAGGLKYR